MDTINLFLLPFSGGSKYSYRSFLPVAPDRLCLVPIELPGRGKRCDEQLLVNLEAIAEDIFNQISDELRSPYAIYGHSMGGVLGYLVIRRIIRNRLPLPLHLFVTGCGGPSRKFSDLVDHTLPKEAFFNKVIELGGSSGDLLANPGLMDFYEPILRADFEAVATYRHTATEPFDIPVTVIFGTEENMNHEDARAWQQETLLPIDVFEMKGNHFFIFSKENEILQLICEKIDRTVSALK